MEVLAQELGLKLGDQNEFTIRRIKRGKNYSFVRANGTPIRHVGTIKRLNSMAVPPAYERSAIRPTRPRICRLSAAMPPAGCNIAITPTGKRFANSARRIGWRGWSRRLPKIRRNVSAHLSGDAPTREFALSAVIELIARTAIRPGNESDARSTAPAAPPRC